MINAEYINKVDNIYTDGGSSVFNIESLDRFDGEQYDIYDQKDYARMLKDIETICRTSFEYRQFIAYLRNTEGMNTCSFLQNVTNIDNTKVKIEIHHTPLTIEDIVRIIYEKRRFYHEDLSLEMVAKEVMECHYKCIVGLYPLTATEHELVHNGYLFIPPQDVFGRYDLFVLNYGQFMEPEDKETLEEIEAYGQNFDHMSQNQILAQSNIYIDPNGAYQLPNMNTLKNTLSNRIETIKNNMYTLPTLEDNQNNKENQMIEGIYFVDENGNRIDDPNS